MRITKCKMNHMTNPIGYAFDTVRLSYLIEDAVGKAQSEARILVARDTALEEIVYDSGFVKDLDFIGVDIPMELLPRTRYYWKVTAHVEQEEIESQVNYFETGKREEAWEARWISSEKAERHPIFFRDLGDQDRSLVTRTIADARLYICGLGLYEAYLNGKKIGNELLTPYCNNYKKWVQYQTYDITEELSQGTKMEVLVGDGWYLGRFGFYSGLVKEEKPQVQRLIAEIHVTYTDGTTSVIGTDESWKVRRSNITFSNIYDGEIVDNTLEEAPAEDVILLTDELPLVERYSIPVVTHEEFRGKLLTTPAGERIFDIGQNLSGLFSLKVNEPKGTKIQLQMGELLQNGNFYRDNLRSAKAQYTYISDGKEHVITPHFTFYGFRYVKVEGVGHLKEEDFSVRAIYSDVEETGKLTTSNPKINRLIENIRWGQKSNFVDVPTDCPQRDERMGWTGDAQVFSPTGMLLTDSYAFYRKYLHDMDTEQQSFKGMVPDVVPSFGLRSCACVWGDAACIIPWNLYQYFGDKRILAEQFGSMKSWVDYMQRIDGDDHSWSREFHYGDWLALDSRVLKADTVYGGTDEAYIAQIYYYHSACIVAKTAHLLKMKEEADTYETLAENIREYITDEFFSKTGRCTCDTQTAQVLALHYDLAPNRALTKKMLHQAFVRTAGKLQTGFTGTPLLCPVLSEAGMDSYAFDLLLNEEYPGWLYEVNLGATTIWERWNSVEADGSISSTGMNSMNHYAYGSILEWMYRYMAGLQQTTPGFREVTIAPRVDERLGAVAMEYASIAGTYKVSWKVLDAGHLELRFEIPMGCRARILLPYETNKVRAQLLAMEGIQVVGEDIWAMSGSYELTYQTNGCMRRIYSSNDLIQELIQNKKVCDAIETMIPGFRDIDGAQYRKTLRRAVLNRTGDLFRERQFDAVHFDTEEQLKQLDQLLQSI